MSWAYFDTSALIKRYVDEEGRREVLQLLRRHQCGASAVLSVELRSALRRRVTDGSLDARRIPKILKRFAADREYWALVEMTSEVLQAAEKLVAAHPLRTLDALHVASAAVEVLGLKTGDTIAEIGAGDARFTFRFAEVVGPAGRVYVNELGASRVRRIQERAERQDLSNVIVVEGAVDDTKLPENCCDYVVMRHVYHMLTAPEPMAKSFFRSAKPGSIVLNMEGDPQPGRPNARGVPANRAGMGIDPQIVIDELSATGFLFDRRVPEWTGSDYALLFRKPGARDDVDAPLTCGSRAR